MSTQPLLSPAIDADAAVANLFLTPAGRIDPYPIYDELRRTSPVHRANLGMWLLSRYDDCWAVWPPGGQPLQRGATKRNADAAPTRISGPVPGVQVPLLAVPKPASDGHSRRVAHSWGPAGGQTSLRSVAPAACSQ